MGTCVRCGGVTYRAASGRLRHEREEDWLFAGGAHQVQPPTTSDIIKGLPTQTGWPNEWTEKARG